MIQDYTERAFSYSGTLLCGHCDRPASIHIESTNVANRGIWNDYECGEHARKYWPGLDFPAAVELSK